MFYLEREFLNAGTFFDGNLSFNLLWSNLPFIGIRETQSSLRLAIIIISFYHQILNLLKFMVRDFENLSWWLMVAAAGTNLREKVTSTSHAFSASSKGLTNIVAIENWK